MTLSKHQDEDLVRMAQNGSEEAFTILLTRYRSLIWGLAFRICRSEEDAYDVCQETAVRLWKNIRSYRPFNSFQSWLRTIAVNEALRWLKSRKNERVTIAPEESIPWDLHSGANKARFRLETEDKKEAIMSAMEKLSPSQNTAMVLRYFEDLSISEIARLMNCSEGSVKKHLFRAMDKLKRSILLKEVR